MKKVTVRVEKYWLGVKSQEMIVYTGMGDGDCGVPYLKGKRYFFWASRSRDLLETDICSHAKVNDRLVDDLNDIFGKAEEPL